LVPRREKRYKGDYLSEAMCRRPRSQREKTLRVREKYKAYTKPVNIISQRLKVTVQ